MTTEEVKKYSIFIVLGITLILGLLGVLVPEAREYLSGIVKSILPLIPSFI